MLNENIKTLRKAGGLSQEELAVKLNVVRQTVSKWEQGLSVPDADMLIALAEALKTTVNTLLGETVTEAKPDDLKTIAEKLEVINLQLSQMKEAKRKKLHRFCIGICVVILIIFAGLYFAGSPYLDWNYSDPETAVIGTAYHIFEFVFVRVAPFALIGAVIATILTRKKES